MLEKQKCPAVRGIIRFGRRLLSGDVIGYGKGMTAFGTAAGKNLAAILGGHSQAEAVLVDSSAVRGLKSPFHLVLRNYYLLFRAVFRHSAAKLTKKSHIRKYGILCNLICVGYFLPLLRMSMSVPRPDPD